MSCRVGGGLTPAAWKTLRIGFILLELVRKSLGGLELIEVARGPMEVLVEGTEETAC